MTDVLSKTCLHQENQPLRFKFLTGPKILCDLLKIQKVRTSDF